MPSFGAQTTVVNDPTYGESYDARVWVRGSRRAGSRVQVVLFTIRQGATGWVVDIVDSRTRPLRGGWQRLSVQGRVKTRGAAVLDLQVKAEGAVKSWSRLAVDGVVATAGSSG